MGDTEEARVRCHRAGPILTIWLFSTASLAPTFPIVGAPKHTPLTVPQTGGPGR